MSHEEIPDEVTPEHRNRPACVYVRLEEYPTLPRALAELELQRAQRHHAERWGSPGGHRLFMILVHPESIFDAGSNARDSMAFGRSRFGEL